MDQYNSWINRRYKYNRWYYSYSFVNFGYVESTYEDIGTASALARLGICIYLLAKKNEKMSEQKNEERDEKVRQVIEECQSINRETKEFLKSYNKEMQELMKAFATIKDTVDRKD